MRKQLHCYLGDGSKTEHGTVAGPNGETFTHVSYDVSEVWTDRERSPDELAKIKSRRWPMLDCALRAKK